MHVSSSIKAAKARNQERLLAIPGVVSVGIGRDGDGNPVIVVGLAAADPQIASSVPGELDGFPVVSEVVGQLRAQ